MCTICMQLYHTFSYGHACMQLYHIVIDNIYHACMQLYITHHIVMRTYIPMHACACS